MAARGLDIPKVQSVIHYDVARSPQVFCFLLIKYLFGYQTDVIYNMLCHTIWYYMMQYYSTQYWSSMLYYAILNYRTELSSDAYLSHLTLLLLVVHTSIWTYSPCKCYWYNCFSCRSWRRLSSQWNLSIAHYCWRERNGKIVFPIIVIAILFDFKFILMTSF